MWCCKSNDAVIIEPRSIPNIPEKLRSVGSDTDNATNGDSDNPSDADSTSYGGFFVEKKGTTANKFSVSAPEQKAKDSYGEDVIPSC